GAMSRNPSLRIESTLDPHQVDLEQRVIGLSVFSNFINLHVDCVLISSFMSLVIKRYQKYHPGQWQVRATEHINLTIINDGLPDEMRFIRNTVDGSFIIK
ncbi:hypothetical protein PENTCL1PPCAC_9134, partial [Pristionchus entomophagus]